MPVAAVLGTPPRGGAIGILVTRTRSTAQGLISALAATGAYVESLGVVVDGTWRIYLNGAPAVVNSAFPLELDPLTAFFVRTQRTEKQASA